jgi:hypothetical protein
MALTIQSRIGLGLLAFAGSAVYAASFIRAADARLISAMACVGIAAGISWVIFGLILLAVTRGRVSVVDWVDTCLVVMALGIAIKMTGVAANLVSPRTSLAAHISILVAADLAMGTLFVIRAMRLAVRAGEAVACWLILNALFISVLLLLFHGVIR